MSDSLFHYGIKRRSGRYPWGSGDDPYQSEPSSYASRMKAKQIGTKASGSSKKNTDDVIEGEYKEHKSGKKKNKKKGSSGNGENNNVDEETYAEAQEARKVSKDKKNKESKSKDSDNQSNDQSNNDSKNNKKKNKEKTTGETINKYGQDTIKGLKSLNTNARQTYRLATTEDLSGYTDDQLRALINRMNLENQYYNSKAHSTTKSQEVVNKILDTTGSALKIGTSVYDLSNFIDEKAKRAKKILY